MQLPTDLPEGHARYRRLLEKLGQRAVRHAELQEQMNDPAVLASPQKLIAISKEAGQLAESAEAFSAYIKAVREWHELREMQAAGDGELAEVASAELPVVLAKADALLERLKEEFVSAEDANVARFFLEIRAGTGGEEAALFARNLFEMYRKYAEQKGWRFEVEDFSDSERGGFKEVIAAVSGNGAYRRLQFEGGGHRVQRVPETEAQGRIHTSAATVAVMPEMPDVQIEISQKDIEEGGCRGGGPGGQNVNKVETGWRITHKPTGLQFKITEHKSQAQNRDRAWTLLRSTLYERERSKQLAEQSSARRSMMGSGDRSQRIRTYNFPQNRCTDHRLGGEGGGEKNFNLDQVIAGNLDDLTDALLEMDKQQRLDSL